ncbi:Predicted PurR-regulated permease PerM [Cohaesibacter sp. ES.047]|uniref:AI-2E family transporter n=1 Tax=Cohaesibacter sp. ES.047 TaxID=1798205 RepID=UPI000BC0BD2F|nr:AI-2E family transporter [Cohaesibacter sp. ES.047]SNY93809.1 Predicted PurR-regulated permease PerM [Cohaesibacter sp. ES.047]
MSIEKQFTIWMITLAVVILCLYLFRGILLPFVAGMALAYMLDPVADFFQRLGMNRIWATVSVLLLFVLFFVLMMVMIVPTLAQQMTDFADNLPGYIASLQDLLIKTSSKYMPSFLSDFDASSLQNNVKDLVGQGASWIGKLIQSIWNGGQALIDMLALIVITPVVAFYMLHDWDRMVETVDHWLPRDHVDTIRHLANEINRSVSGFVRGQIIVGLILGIFYAVALSILGLNFGLLIGLGAGIISFIPYAGATLGLVVSLGVAIVQYWPDPVPIGITLAIFAVGQFLEGNFLQPRLVGERVGLHPVWLMFALLAFGSLFGFVGMLIAVPTAAAIGVIIRYILDKYMHSSMYRGQGDGLNAAPSHDTQAEG